MIVRCNGVTKSFPTHPGHIGRDTKSIKAVDEVSLSIKRGEIFGLVGESGSGKTTLGKIILGAIKPDSGKIELDTEKKQVVFQDPYNSLDPKMRVFDILAEGLLLRRANLKNRFFTSPSASFRMTYSRPVANDAAAQNNIQKGGKLLLGLDVRKKVEEALDLVKLPKTSLNKYPHQFSGGERQRIAIGRALITEPEFIVCDEPVSSLDVTIQLQILRLLKGVQKRFNITYLFISHDLRVVRFMCDRVAVMKDGKIVEEGGIAEIYSNPAHQYTKLLLSSILGINGL